ncbi:protein DJ-1 homolog D [Tanacetum coccineum]
MRYHCYNPHENKVYVARHAKIFKNMLKYTRSEWESHFAKSNSGSIDNVARLFVNVMVPFQALQAYGLLVDAVCPGKKSGDICRTAIHQTSNPSNQQTYSESRGHNFTLNATFDEIDLSTYDGLVLPGGRAPEYLAMDERVLNLVTHFSKSGKPITSICHGQLILAAADILKGQKVTAYPAVGPVLVAAGAHWVEPQTLASCTLDGNIITGASYHGHAEYVRHFIKALGGTVTGSDKRILFLCGDYMEDYEVYVPFQSLEALGCHVDAICPNKNAGETCPTAVHDFEGDQTYSEKPGHDFKLTANFKDIDASSYDALVIPGGRAPEYLALDPAVIKLVKDFMEAEKHVASICHGQQILSAVGVLKGKKCTAYPAVKLNVVLGGGTWLEPDPIDRCFTDGNLVTGAAWPGHPHFISQLMSLLGIKSNVVAASALRCIKEI